jgi:hypothetical protein
VDEELFIVDAAAGDAEQRTTAAELALSEEQEAHGWLKGAHRRLEDEVCCSFFDRSLHSRMPLVSRLCFA